MTFDQAFQIVVAHEGGYVNDPRDPGGETKYGISKRAYPNENIQDMTLARAKEIYKRDYWDKIRADDLPKQVRFSAFDTAVNAGVVQSVKFIQRAVGVMDDGIIGPKTLAAVRAMDMYKLAAIFNGLRLQHLASLQTFTTFGRGWARRIAENLINIS